jgi:hypothetical protein
MWIGEFRRALRAPRAPGRWLLRGVEARKSTEPDMNFDAKSTTLTFEVLEK